MKIYFATGNRHKFEETGKIMAGQNIGITHFPFRHFEIRSDSLKEIAEEAVTSAYAEIKKPVFVEDTGLFINTLNGFPGTYSAWALKKIGTAGILKLLESKTDRTAFFETAIAYHDGEKIHAFEGKCEGEITREAMGTSGFGYDSIFAPQGYSTTFAQNIALKSKLSHRYNSLLKMLDYLKSVSTR